MQDRLFYSVKPHFVGINLGALVFILSGTSQLSSGDASDSICPKGWGIIRYNGSGEYQKLIAKIWSITSAGKSLTTNKYLEYNNSYRPDNFIVNNNLAYVRSKRYIYSSGKIREANTGILSWSMVAQSASSGGSLDATAVWWGPYYNPKGNGFSLRCVAK